MRKIAPKFHRDARPIPTDLVKRRRMVKWCLGHRLWHYPVTVREPPPGREGEHLGPADERGTREWIFDRPDWVDATALMGGFYECVDLEVAYVDPATETIEDDASRNTAFRCWVEAGGWADLAAPERADYGGVVPEGGWRDDNRWQGCHDPRLDCGGPDMETAILELAARVEFFYGDGADDLPGVPARCARRRVDGAPGERERWEITCVADPEGYCATCGYGL